MNAHTTAGWEAVFLAVGIALWSILTVLQVRALRGRRLWWSQPQRHPRRGQRLIDHGQQFGVQCLHGD